VEIDHVHDGAQLMFADRVDRGGYVKRAKVGARVGRASAKRDRAGPGRRVGATRQVVGCGRVLSARLSFPRY
jgi:hypothetical protein